MTGPAGWGAGDAAMLRCNGHELTAVYRTADGALWAPRVDLSVATPQPVACHLCGCSHLVDPVALRDRARSQPLRGRGRRRRRSLGVSDPQ